MSPAAKLCGFLLLLAAVFLGAHAAGAKLGPVTVETAPAPGTSAPGAGGSHPGPGSPGTGGR